MQWLIHPDNWLKNLAENSSNNGFLTFVLGALFVLSIFHFFLYFQHKDKAYLYYSLYTFLIGLTYLTKVEAGFLKNLVDISHFPNTYEDFFRWSYNCIYFIFALEFLNLKQINRRWYKYICYPILVILSLGIFAQILLCFFNFKGLYNIYSQLYVPIIVLHTMFSFYFIFKLKGSLKWYIIIGAIILFVTSLIGEYVIRKALNITEGIGNFYFYLGVLIEVICFSLGLGHKQKKIIEERNEASNTLITKLQENEALKETVNLQLQEKIDGLNEQIEFKQEIADLKLKALRSQMNPHFIFNSLNSIKLYIINNEKENAVHYLNKFAKLIRKILVASIEKEISLEEELETSELYLTIENIRFDNAIIFKQNINPKINTKTVRVPSLILQPFLENALWHGLSAKNGDKKITIDVTYKGNEYVQLIITDNGIGRAASQKINIEKSTKEKSVGIEITKERLANFSKPFPNNYHLEIIDLFNKDQTSAGTQVVIDIPVKEAFLFN